MRTRALQTFILLADRRHVLLISGLLYKEVLGVLESGEKLRFHKSTSDKPISVADLVI
jgi:hypothetical protein